MLKWLDVIKYANKGNLTPDRRVEKTDEEWKALRTEEQYYITRQKGTERANSSDLCTFFEAGKYTCVCCETLLFDSAEKFDSDKVSHETIQKKGKEIWDKQHNK